MTERRRNTDEADAWFYDLGLMARRIEAEEERQTVIRRRQYVVTAFMLFAFLLLAWRSEVNRERIDRNTGRITDTQIASCQGSLVILEKYNTLLEDLAKIESRNTAVPLDVRKDRVDAYMRSRISPLPMCDEAGRRIPQ